MKHFAQPTTGGPRSVFEVTDSQSANSQRSENRTGTAMVIVLTLMGALLFLGYFFFISVTAERDAAKWFAAQPKQVDPDGGCDIYFDFALQQLLLGPTDDYRHSALYGRKHSLIPNLIGTLDENLRPTDTHPYTGQGIAIRFRDIDTAIGSAADDGIPDNNTFQFDYDRDGTNDFSEIDFIINYSPSANGGTAPASVPDYSPDVDYTYPDINSMFLSHLGKVGYYTNGTNFGWKVAAYIPSFHRPQYLRSGPQSNPIPDDLYSNSTYKNRILTPHQSHDTYNQTADTWPIRRYTYPGGPTFGGADDEHPNPAGTSVNIGYFPFLTESKEGVWSFKPNATDSTLTLPIFRSDEKLNTDTTEYQFDIDNDGVKESLLIDLDFPISEFPNGDKYVPIFAFKIECADGLLNLNAGGNLNETRGFGPTYETPSPSPGPSDIGYRSADVKALEVSTTFQSTSNLGLSISEINISRALYANPGSTAYYTGSLDDILDPHQGMFDFTGTSVNRLQMANMEMARLLFGSPQYDSTRMLIPDSDVIPGRWGEPELLISALAGGSGTYFPGPGLALTDDDADSTTFTSVSVAENNASYFGGGVPFIDPIYTAGGSTVTIPAYVHPLDFNGLGWDYLNNVATGNTRRIEQVSANSPVRWPAYAEKWNHTSTLVTGGVTPYSRAGDPTITGVEATFPLLKNPGFYWLYDESDELLLDPNLRDPVNDRVFDASEMATLHIHNTADFNNVNPSTRIRQLAPFNFGDDNPRADEIRSQFTTDSWDRMEFSWFQDLSGSTSSRSWEYTNNIFPPLYGTAGAKIAAKAGMDPIRPVVRDWLRVEVNHTNSVSNQDYLPQRKLNINKILDDTNFVNTEELEPEFRNLTPHPVFAGSGADGTKPTSSLEMVHSNYPMPAGTDHPFYTPTQVSSNKYVQEWWAQYDRQRLARDIYVLLYTFGAGQPGSDITESAYYTTTQLKEMAQFAVNYVDALDRDDVITKFVYDTNLSNGWSPVSTDVVYGVETQSLTLSESLYIFAQGNDTIDHQATLFDDRNKDHQFLYVELRNSSPFAVPLGTGTWRIRTETVAESPIGTLTFKAAATTKTVGAGENFTIGTHEGDIFVQGTGATRSATFRIDLDYNNDLTTDQDYRALIPYKVEASSPMGANARQDDPLPLLDLDLAHITDRGNGGTTAFFNEASDDPLTANGYLFPPVTTLHSAPQPNIRIILERRRSLTALEELTETENEWIRVDSMLITTRELVLGTNDLTTNPSFIYNNTDGTLGQMTRLESFERREPLTALDDSAIIEPSELTYDGNSNNKLLRHTFGGPTVSYTGSDPSGQPPADPARYHLNNSVDSSTQNEYWQPHFNRDFSSVFELLSIPLFAPNEFLPEHPDPATMSNLRHKGYVNFANSKMDGKHTALSKFTNPDNPDGGLSIGAIDSEDNRWYRIFGLLEVDSTSHGSLRDKLTIPRLPGKLQLNTIRHSNVFGALIDDSHINNTNNGFTNLEDPQETIREWYEQFLLSRDGYDPYWLDQTQTETFKITLPGTPAARPFRSMNYEDTLGNSSTFNTSEAIASLDSIENTLLRTMRYYSDSTFPVPAINGITPQDNQEPLATNRRPLFDAQTRAGFNSKSVDSHTRNRLLSKISNLTTNRSHVFIVWIGVQFHKAEENVDGVVRVGEKYDESIHQSCRGFIVVDRSRLEEAYDPVTRKFDFREFIISRETVQ